MFTSIGMDMIWPTKDRVIVEIPINAPEYQLPDGGSTTVIPVELIVTSMRNIKNLHSQHAYLKKFIGPVQVKAMPPNPE